MNELVNSAALPTASWSEVSMSWLLVTAAGILIFSLVEAWIATLILYGKVTLLKKMFPASHNLIRSHVDYSIMAALLGVTYFFCLYLNIVLPKVIIVLLCLGVIYNPFGFFIKAINPNAGQSDTLLGRIAVCLTFIPTTVGFGYAMFAVIATLFRFS